MAGLRTGRGAWYFVVFVVMAMAAVATVGRLFGGALGGALECGGLAVSMHFGLPVTVVTVGSGNDDEMENV